MLMKRTHEPLESIVEPSAEAILRFLSGRNVTWVFRNDDLTAEMSAPRSARAIVLPCDLTSTMILFLRRLAALPSLEAGSESSLISFPNGECWE